MSREFRVVTEIMQSTSVQRLRGIIKSRYGKGLTVRYVVDSKSIDFNHASPQIHNGDLQIPIFVGEKFLGLATISSVDNISSREVGPIVDLVKMVLEPVLHNWYIETNRGLVLTNSGAISNRVSDESFQGESILVDEDYVYPTGPVVSTSAEIIELDQTLAKGAFLVSDVPLAIPRWGLVIHETLNRWAFLHYSDLGKEIKNKHELQSLGAVTLLIDDIALLTKQQQDVLADFLETSDPATEPIILFGSTISVSELKSRNSFNSAILGLLAPFEIELDRLPRHSKQVEEALRMLLDAEAASLAN